MSTPGGLAVSKLSPSDDDRESDLPDLAGGDREEILAVLDDLIQEAHDKAANGRVRDAENEKVRQGWFRTVGYLAGQYRQLKKDEQLDEMQAELDLLKEVNGLTDDD